MRGDIIIVQLFQCQIDIRAMTLDHVARNLSDLLRLQIKMRSFAIPSSFNISAENCRAETD